MAVDEDLENVISTKIKPVIDEAVHRFIGVSVDGISTDITDKLKKMPLLDFNVNTNIPFKEAKKNFKKQYLIRILKLNQGSISNVAKLAKVDRRSIHRMIAEMRIDIENLRKKSFDIDYLKQSAIKDVINETLDLYKDAIKAKKLKKLYLKSLDISADILKEIPNGYLSLEDAEKEFEKRYIKKAMEENNFNVCKTAMKIRLRYETLHRKVKKLNLS